MAVTIDDVRHIATLARLGLPPERAESLVAELNTILAHMDVLSRVDTAAMDDDVVGDSRGAPLRADVGPSAALVRPIDAFAPNVRDGFFLVPRLATHEEPGDVS